MGFSVTAGHAGIHSGIPESLNYKLRLEGDISRLKKQREDFEKENSVIGAATKGRIQALEKRIDVLQERLDKLKDKEHAPEQEDAHCETCENRRYQDGSDDPGVSFKTAGKIDPANAEAVVRGHEYEHVNRNQAKAEREGREVVYQNVLIKHGICPECGDSYVAGGETVTVTRVKREDPFAVGMKENENGELLDVRV